MLIVTQKEFNCDGDNKNEKAVNGYLYNGPAIYTLYK